MRSSDSPALAGCVERRSQGRYPVTLELEYRGTGSEECFPGKTTDITSSGVRFSCEDRTFPIGATVELRIKWPTPPAETRQLELVVEGQVVRSHDGETALHTTRYRFGMRQMTAIRASRIGLAAG